MSTPIKTSSTQGTTPVVNDLMNRLNSQAQNAMSGAGADSPEQAFSRWLDKHAIGADQARRPEPQPANAGNKPAAPQQQANLAATRASEQALARARQLSSQQNARPAQGVDPNTRAEARPATKARTDQNQAAKTGRKESAPKSSQTEGSDQTEEAAKDDKETSFHTAAGEGAAVVRELTPPSTIHPGDSASMMAWLASLTNGDATQQGLPPGEAAQGDQAEAGKEGDAAVIDLNGKGAGHGKPGGMTLDLQAWQGVNGKAEAAMEQLGKGALETDPMAGLMPGAAGKASFNQILNEATQTVRHESATLNAPFGSPEFPQALAEKVSMWVNTAKDNGPMTAELHLNPADMGPINVKISLDGQSAHVDFAAAALETRQAIEASMPMLSSALGDVGLNLTGGGVSSQTSQQAFEQAARDSGAQSARASGGRRGDGQPDDGDEGLSVRQVSAPRPGRVGGLDLYA